MTTKAKMVLARNFQLNGCTQEVKGDSVTEFIC